MRFRNPNSVKELLQQLSLTDIYTKTNVAIDHPVLKDTTLCEGKYSKVTVDDQNSPAAKRFMLGIENRKTFSIFDKSCLDNFYCAAPVPRCLGLYDGQHVSEFLQQELSLWCNTGVSMGLTHQGKVVAAGFNLYIDRLGQCSLIKDE